MVKEVRSGEETSRNPLAYAERSPWRYVRTVRLVKTLYLDFLTYGGKTVKSYLKVIIK